MEPQTAWAQSIKGRIITLRIIWGALLIGQVTFAAIVVFVIWPQRHNTQYDPHFLKLLFYVALGMVIVELPVGLIVRNFLYGPPGADGTIDPQRYATGNIIFWALMEGASFLGIVGMLFNGHAMPHAIVPIIAITMQLLTFPTGAPIQSGISRV